MAEPNREIMRRMDMGAVIAGEPGGEKPCPGTKTRPCGRGIEAAATLSGERAERRKGVGRGGKRGAGAPAVVGHLRDKLIDGGKRHFLPDPGDEGDVEGTAIEIAGEIEQEYFQ